MSLLHSRSLLNWRETTKQQLAAGVNTVNIELQVFQIGATFIVAVNGEMFSRFTERVRSATNQNLFVIAYANRAFGYIPTREAYAEGGYEVDTAHFFYQSFRPKPGALELLADRAAAMINHLSNG
jgi:neutral ceramidase